MYHICLTKHFVFPQGLASMLVKGVADTSIIVLESNTEIFMHILAPMIDSPAKVELVQPKRKRQVSSSKEDRDSPVKKVAQNRLGS